MISFVWNVIAVTALLAIVLWAAVTTGVIWLTGLWLRQP